MSGTETAALSGDGQWMPVCGLSRLISQTIVCARVTGVDLILVWNEGRAVACERMCPHEQADLSARTPVGRTLVLSPSRGLVRSPQWPDFLRLAEPAVAAIPGPDQG